MRTLHYHCFAGISGDMNLGVLVDLGVSVEALTAELGKLGIGGWRLEAGQDRRRGIRGTRVRVVLDGEGDEPAGHDHTQTHDHSHSHGHDHGHSHSHAHSHAGQRGFAEIRTIIEASTLSDTVKRHAVGIFRTLAEAEAAVHETAIDDVHFHEVGAVDSIVDIVGAAIGLELLGVERVTSSAVELGGGAVMCAHGRMPVPAPATALLVRGMPVTVGGTGVEQTTPTGAAYLAYAVGATGGVFEPALRGRVVGVGTGVGGRDPEGLANVLQATLLESDGSDRVAASGGADGLAVEAVVELAATIDDMTPEEVGALLEGLLVAGARDAWAVPAVMKKSRPGVVVTALALPGELDAVRDAFLRGSTTLGLRETRTRRHVLPRVEHTVATAYGDVRVKAATLPGAGTRVKPEHDDCVRLAAEHGVTLREVGDAARRAWAEREGGVG